MTVLKAFILEFLKFCYLFWIQNMKRKKKTYWMKKMRTQNTNCFQTFITKWILEMMLITLLKWFYGELISNAYFVWSIIHQVKQPAIWGLMTRRFNKFSMILKSPLSTVILSTFLHFNQPKQSTLISKKSPRKMKRKKLSLKIVLKNFEKLKKWKVRTNTIVKIVRITQMRNLKPTFTKFLEFWSFT